MSAGEPVETFVYYDYSCPFCYVGDRRLRALREERPLEVHWRPYAIHPGIPEEGLPVKELGYPPDQWSRMTALVEEMADELDLEYRTPSFVPSTREALHASAFARDLGREPFRRLHVRLFRAYFADGRNIGRRDVLLDEADRAGVDPEGLARALEDERYGSELEQIRAEAERYDVTGTPTFLFGRHKVVGAAPMEVLEEAAERASSEGRAAENARDPGSSAGEA